MKIEVLGTGCSRCAKLMEAAQQIVKELGVEAKIVKINKIEDILSYGVMITPALVIDGAVVSAGRVPSKEEIIRWIQRGIVQ